MSGNAGLERAFETLHAATTGAILDVGAGAGRHLSYYQSENAYHVLELSDTALMLFANRLEARDGQKPEVTLEQGDAQAWRGEPESYEGAMLAYTLSTMKRPWTAVENIAHTVRNGGAIVILDYIGQRDRRAPLWIIKRNAVYDPTRSLDTLIGDAPLALQHSEPIWPEPSLNYPPARLCLFTRH